MTLRYKIEIFIGLIIVIFIALFVFRDKPNTLDTAQTDNQAITKNSNRDSEINFSEIGNIVNTEPTKGNTNLKLIYEKPGAPALSVDLLFNEKSMCGSETEKIVCMAMSRSFENGLRVKIFGIRTDDTVEVREMVFVEEN